MRSAASVVIESIENRPHEWSASSESFKHKPSGMVLYVGGGPSFLRCCDCTSKVYVKFGMVGSRRVYAAYKRWTVGNLMSALGVK